MTRATSAEATSNSALLTGDLRHRRHRPRPHAFRYRVFHVLLDLDELPVLDRRVRGFGHNRRAVFGFRDVDHLGPDDRPVRDKLADLLAAEDVALPDGAVTLWTTIRVLGHVFNPVSWFFCHDADGTLELVVAEVNNTFGDTYCYVLSELQTGGSGRVTARAAKRLHVSPFMPVDGQDYDFAFHPPPLAPPPGSRAVVHMDVTETVVGRETHADDGSPAFDATVVEHTTALSTRNLWLANLRHPLVGLRTVFLIHWQAMQLFVKRTRFHRRPEAPRNHLPGTTGFRAAHGTGQITATSPDDRHEPPRDHADATATAPQHRTSA